MTHIEKEYPFQVRKSIVVWRYEFEIYVKCSIFKNFIDRIYLQVTLKQYVKSPLHNKGTANFGKSSIRLYEVKNYDENVGIELLVLPFALMYMQSDLKKLRS